MQRVLVIQLNHDKYFIYPEDVKILDNNREFSYNNAPCIYNSPLIGWSGYGALYSDIKKPKWFQPPYVYCYLDKRGNLL